MILSKKCKILIRLCLIVLATAAMLGIFNPAQASTQPQLQTQSQTQPSAILDAPWIDGFGPVRDVKQISIGRTHNCLVTNTGAVKCWGSNVYGQLGDGAVDFQVSSRSNRPGFRTIALVQLFILQDNAREAVYEKPMGI